MEWEIHTRDRIWGCDDQMWVCKQAMEWRSGREHERRTSVHEGKSYNCNKGVTSEHGSGQLGEWRLIGD